MLRRLLGGLAWIGPWLVLLTVQADDPIRVWPALEEADGAWQLRVRFEMPARHYLYAERLSIAMSEAGRHEDFTLPPPTTQVESADGTVRLVHARTFEAIRRLGPSTPEPMTLLLHYQGCDGDNCFMPRARRWRLEPGSIPHELESTEAPEDASPTGPWKSLATDFNIVAQGGGTPTEAEWTRFLQAIPERPAASQHSRTEPLRARLLLGASGAALALCLGFAWLGRAQRLPARLTAKNPAWLAGAFAVVFAAGFLLERSGDSHPPTGTPAQLTLTARSEPPTEQLLAQALDDARRSGRPVFVTFWTTDSAPLAAGTHRGGWPEVVDRQLSRFVRLNLRIDDPQASPARELCGFFSIRGLPAYLVLVSKADPEPIPGPGAHCEPNHQVK